jgi:putative hydrolase of the HAD superfamily
MSIDPVTADVWVFDLDNTLYPRDCDLFAQIDVKMKSFISQLLSIDEEEAHRIQKEYFHTHGTTLRGLMDNHGLAPSEFLDYVHDIDVSPVPPNPALDDVLHRLPGRKIIYTNGSVIHAENVSHRLGIRHHFDGIFDIIAADYNPKPAREPYAQMIRDHDVDPTRAVMLEDIARNLAPAHELGMTTVWIRSEHDHSAMGSDGDHVHHVIDDLVEWLEEQLE